MISYKITEVKPFMAKLLASTAFDDYILKELELQTFATFTVSGQLHEDFFSKEELEERKDSKNVLWSEVRPIAFNMIKGNKTPLALKIIFQLPQQQCSELTAASCGKQNDRDLGGLYLNIRFEKGELRIITGTAIKTFTLDKTLEREWDARVGSMLKELCIIFEEDSY